LGYISSLGQPRLSKDAAPQVDRVWVVGKKSPLGLASFAPLSLTQVASGKGQTLEGRKIQQVAFKAKGEGLQPITSSGLRDKVPPDLSTTTTYWPRPECSHSIISQA
jgi:hypothetical protein